MMTLIAIGILVSYLYSCGDLLVEGEVFYEAAAMLTTFSLAGHWLEMRIRFATGRAVEALLVAGASHRSRHAATARRVEVPLEQVAVGDEIVVRPGDRSPSTATSPSGIVLRGRVDDHRRAGAGGQDGRREGGRRHRQPDRRLHLHRDRSGADTALARIVQMVRNAQASKAPAQRLADTAGQISGLRRPRRRGSHLSSVGTFSASRVPLRAHRRGLRHRHRLPRRAGARHTHRDHRRGRQRRPEGVLFKNATALEATAAINTVVFDKTGTLTEGKPALTDVHPGRWHERGRTVAPGGSADQPSQHPLAEAIVRGRTSARGSLECRQRRLRLHTGQGVAARASTGGGCSSATARLMARGRVSP